MGDPLIDLMPAARRRWARTDPVLHAIAREHPAPARAVDRSGSPFEALASSIVHQQVSVAAGRTIYGRVAQTCGGTVTPEGLLAAGPERLRAAGLSRSKAAYALDLAQRARSGELDFARLASATDDEVVESLTAVKGIGAWTAKMFMIFHLARPDVLAHEDLGLQVAVAKAYRVPRAKAAAKMRRLAPAWSPYASVASLSLWNWRRVGMEREAAAKAAARTRRVTRR